MTLETAVVTEPQLAAPVAARRAPPSDDGIILLSSPTRFNMADEWYELAAAEHFWFQWRFRAIQTVLGAAGLPGPALEIGCGNGVARDQLEAAYGADVDGCDVNQLALRKARPGRGRLYFYDIHERRPEWRGHFSSVALLDTLEHIDEPERFLESVAYHLRPGGRLLLNVPAQQWLYSRYDRVAGHVKRYTVATLRRELRAVGLSLERHAYWGLTLVPVALARKLMLRFCSPTRVIQMGFEPGKGLVNVLLRTLMRIECWCGPRMPCGASLAAVARKEGG